MAEKKAQDPKGAEKPKTNKKLLIIIAAVVLLLAGVGAGVFFYVSGGDADEALAQAQEKADASGAKDSTAIGPMVEVPDFIINILDEKDSRYLKAALTLELDDPMSVPEVEQRMPQIRDAILLHVGNKTFGEVRDLQGKLQLRAELIARINALLQNAKVTKVYFTDFVVQ